MKSSETDLLIIPGTGGAEVEHWQRRIAAKLSTARVVEQPDWHLASLSVAVGEVVEAVRLSSRPVVLIAHSAGATLVAHAVPSLRQMDLLTNVRGAFLVSPPSERTLAASKKIDPAFAAIPRDPLPFRSIVVASSTDPHTTLEEAAELSLLWGSQFVEAGEAGHINVASGHGPWPEGLMRFAGFLSKL